MSSGRKDEALPGWLPPFRWQVGLAIAFTALFILWGRQGWGGERLNVFFTDLASTLVPAGAAWACWLRSRRVAPELRTAWLLLAAAAASWSLGQLYWTWHETRTGQAPAVPSPADIGYLMLIPFAAIGVSFLARREKHAGFDPRPLLDGAIVGASFIFAAFSLGLEDIVLESDRADTGLIVNLLYPFGDGLVLGVVLMRLSRAPARGRAVVAMLAGGFAMLAIADLWFLVVDAQGVYSTGGVVDAFWVMGFQLIGLAAVRPVNLAEAVDAPQQSKTLAMVPLYPFIVAVGFGMAAEVRVGYFSDTLFWTAAVVVMLVLLRLVIMAMDNIGLSASLRQAQHERTMMLNNVTHDLLSPLSAVRIQLKLLQDDHLGPRTDRQANALAVAHRNVERVQRLGGDLKDLANLEGAKGLVILPAPFDLAGEARRAAATFHAEAEQRGVRLEVAAPEPVQVVGDAGRIGQVLDNLLSNALKFTPAGGRVTVDVATTGTHAALTVADTGRGLDTDEAQRLFRPFSQVHQPGEVKERGTGLGLYISRGIAEGHGGTLTVTSAGRRQGSAFRLAIPLAGRPGALAPLSQPSPAAAVPDGVQADGS